MKTTKRRQGSAATRTAQKTKAAPAKVAPMKVPAVAEPVPAGPARAKSAHVKSGGPGIVLASNCSVKDAAALKTSLCKLADEIGDVTVDAGSVERIDTATMQLLCAFVQERVARERNILWLGNSRVLQEAARLLGVQKLLALPETEFKGAAA